MKGKSIMTENKNQLNLALLIYDVYPHSDLLPVEPETDCKSMETLLAKVTYGDIWDDLFKFIVTEIVEGGEGTLEGAIQVIERGKEDMESVLQALYAASNSQSNETDLWKPEKIMYLYEVQATEYNSRQEYSQSKLIAAENIEQARKIARDYFSQWYDDDDLENHNISNPDEFEFACGSIKLKINSIEKIAFDKWIKNQITLHSISELPQELTKTKITCSSVELLEACRNITSYTRDLLYRMDNQVNLNDIEEVRQARDAIDKHSYILTHQS